ncbi:MAG: hypothetical protein WC522_07605 [Candidatus Omnitrophota bacterium]
MVVMGIVLLLILVILVVIVVKAPLPLWGKIGFLLVLVVSIFLVKAIRGFLPLPIGIRHLVNLTIQPKDLYTPIITDEFLFYEKGYTKTYPLIARHLDIYELGFLSWENIIPSKYRFDGKLQADFFWKDQLLFSKVITSINSGVYAEKDMAHYKEVSLLKFDIPLEGKYAKNISVRITVLEPALELKAYKDSVKFYVAVSSTP